MVLGLNRKSLVERIDAQLDAERMIILRGDLEALEPLISAREDMVEALEAGLNAGDAAAIGPIQRLQSKAMRNAKLIRAAIEGIEAANKRVAEIEAAHSRLSTYSAEGKLSNVVNPKSSVSKRA